MLSLTQGWARAEMQGARLDTPRRLPNLIRICENLAQNAGKSLSAALGDATRQAAYDLFSRTGRTPADLLAGHVQETARRCQQVGEGRAVIVVQDTVRLDYFTHRACQDLGPIGACPESRGLFAQSALALRRDGLPLGVLAVQFWVRDPAAFGQRHQCRQRRLAEKETRLWGEVARAVEQALPEGVPLVLVADREADLYPFLVQERRPTTQLVVRAYQERRAHLLSEADPAGAAATSPAGGEPVGEASVYLLTAWEHAPVRIAGQRVTVPAHPATPKQPKQPAREAIVEVRSARVRIRRAQALRAGECPTPSGDLWAVWVRELEPPEGEAGLFWLLLTTLDAGTAEGAAEGVAIYRLRWKIEGLHRVLKSGLRVERFPIDDAASLQNALALCFVVAWRLLRLRDQARATPEAPVGAWLTESEQEVLTAKFGSAPQTLHEAVRRVAQLGGWPGASRRTLPGTEVLWRGLRDLAVAVEIWTLAKQAFGPPDSHDTG
jgi:Transposase DNA-binding